ncbi:serine/threonine-protein kinase [Microtetraspora fusca]|uniref:serine/threonine-protein kinase n=1 Tax=Microtetraspora fusca TaxID=1997 RepID=UPI000A9B81FE|nr:serine/threonine-protein kinase [Microtetraspora fusca]
MNDLTPGDPLHIGSYRLLGRLGAGGMGTVYLGESPDGQRVAVKVINPEYSRHEQFRMRFRREADAASRVRRFCTAAVIEAALDGEQLYVVTEFVPGPNLEQAVQSSGPLRGSSLDALAVGVATALAAIHGAGVIHRDLKPSNVLLSPVGPRVIDFGIARARDTLGGITGTGELIGTPRYMSPEVLRGEPVTPACDVFSWGCLVAFAATGRAPFHGETLHAVLYQVLNNEPDLDGLEPALRDLVGRALAKDPEWRPTSQQLLDQMVGRAAAPEQAAHSVQTTWQQTAATVPAAPQRTTAYTAQAPRPSAPDGRPPSWSPPAALGAEAPTGPRPDADVTRLSSSITRRTRRNRLMAGAGAAALAVAAGVALYAVLAPGGPPTDLPLLYQDDFSRSGTGWGNTYTGEKYHRQGYAPGGFYALEPYGEDQNDLWENAPIPFTTEPQSPSPDATPTPTVPDDYLLGVETTVMGVTGGTGEYGLYCRQKPQGSKVTRYEFLLDTSGRARIRKVVEDAGGDLTAAVETDAKVANDVGNDRSPAKQTDASKPTSLQARCRATQEGAELTMWVNGSRTVSVVDARPLPSGLVGIMARVGEKTTATLKVGFDNFTMRGSPEAAR